MVFSRNQGGFRFGGGEVLFSVRRIVCGRCKHHFSPFLQFLGVEPYMRRAADLKDMVASLVCDLSFGSFAEAFKTLLGYVVSRRWIHKTVKEYEVDFGHNEEAYGYMVDGTGENVCEKKRGEGAEAHRGDHPLWEAYYPFCCYSALQILLGQFG
jgi:hypothetical protein